MKKAGAPSVKLKGVFVERKFKPLFSKSFGVAGTRWYAVVALDLYDQERRQDVAEWFFLFACSPEYVEKPLKKFEIDKQRTLIQPALDLEAVKKEAERRFKNVNAKNWDEFYDQMSELFFYEP